MKLFRKILGVLIFVAALATAIAFAFVVLIQADADDVSLALFLIMVSLVIFVFLYYITTTRLAFYQNPPEEKKIWSIIKHVPIVTLIVMLGSIGIRYVIEVREDYTREQKLATAVVPDEKQSRSEIMESAGLSLAEKLIRINLGQVHGGCPIYTASYSVRKIDMAKANGGVSLNDYFNGFSLKESFLRKSLVKNTTMLNDTVFMKFGNGRINPIRNDFKIVGFLAEQNTFIVEEDDIIKSVNAVDGIEFDGLPLFKNNYGPFLYGGIQFSSLDDGIYLEISVWYRNESNQYQLIQRESIPMDYYFSIKKSLCEIDNIQWGRDQWNRKEFKFTIRAQKSGREEFAEIVIRVDDAV